MTHDLLIIGGGPAGSAAGVYAARKRIKTVLVAEEFGGQSSVSVDVQNWVGVPHIAGSDIGKKLKEHLEEYADDVLDIVENDKVVELKEVEGGYEAKTEKGQVFKTKAVLAASGSRRRKLPAEGAERLDGKGVVYCASCDAPLFGGMDVVVVGGGNAGFESAQQLTEYAKSILILERNGEWRADPVTQEKVLGHDKVTAKLGADIKEIKGDKFVESVVYEDKEGEHEVKAQGVFVEIGSIPNNGYLGDMVDQNDFGEVIVDHKTQRASKEGIWAAGDLSDVLYKQNNISMGDGVKALEDIYLWLNKQK